MTQTPNTNFADIEKELQQTAQSLLAEKSADKKVDLVIGFGEANKPGETGGAVAAVFITDPAEVILKTVENSSLGNLAAQRGGDITEGEASSPTRRGCTRLVWNDKCVINLVAYLHRREVKNFARVAIVVKGCDAKSLAVLEAESQIDRAKLVVIGVACAGCTHQGNPLKKCTVCDVHNPQHCDIVLGKIGDGNNAAIPAEKRYAALAEFLAAKSFPERLDYWREELSRCIKCYACRQVCPLCYCQQCIVEKNRPQRIETSSHLRGNFAWNITRAFHLAGRCTQCGSCGAVCPMGIDLGLLNSTLARAAEENFADFRSGYDPTAAPIIGSFSEHDHEEFIK